MDEKAEKTFLELPPRIGIFRIAIFLSCFETATSGLSSDGVHFMRPSDQGVLAHSY
jgi:hypothetical protein